MALIKIKSNPYTREIEYFEDGQEIELANPNCRLCEIDKKSNFLPFHAREIIDIIIDSYYAGEKVEVVFEGTSEEFDELAKVCSADEIANKIVLTSGTNTLENAQSILTETKELFQTVQPIIKKILNEDSAICHDIKLVSDTLDDIIPICVFGNVSSGKSTFINALIGSEILPNGGDPVTAKIYEIKKSKENNYAKIQLTYHEDPICFTFENGHYTIEGVDSDLVQKLKSDLAELNSDELIIVAHKALEIINAHEKVDQETIDIGSIIRVEVPFSDHGILGQSKTNFVIFDTPGSNSASNKDHTEVLKEALKGFSNGIPVWVSPYDSLDSTDNDRLCEMLLELKALDNRFTVIVVNKADSASLPRDGFPKKQINDILEYCAIEKMYAAGIFFVSSIMGLGAKLKGNFASEDYEEIYFDQYAKYSHPNHKFHKKLYSYNIMPTQIKEDLCKDSEGCPDPVYANSGLFGIERQMEIFGVKYAAYNKCQMAYAFLSQAIKETARIIAEDAAALKELKNTHESEFADQERCLIAEINAMVAERGSAFTVQTITDIMEFVRTQLDYSYSQEDMESLDQKIAEKLSEVTDWNDYKATADDAEANVWRNFIADLRKSKSAALSKVRQKLAQSNEAKKNLDEAQRELDSQTSDLVLTYVANDYRKNLMEAKERISLATEYNWKKCIEQLKQLLIEKVTNSSGLTDAQRERLSGIIVEYQPMAFNDDTESVFIKARFLRGNILGMQTSERLNIRRLAAQYNEQLSRNITALAEMINARRAAAFKTWATNLVAAIESNIVELNPELRAKADLIQTETEKIAEYENDQLTIINALKEIRYMMEWKTVDTEGA